MVIKKLMSFICGGGLASIIQLRKWASRADILVLQRGTKAEDMGEGSVLGRPHRVLFRYTNP